MNTYVWYESAIINIRYAAAQARLLCTLNYDFNNDCFADLQGFALFFGKNHPIVANDCSNLGKLLLMVNRKNEVEQYFLHALRINEKNFGDDHHSVAVQCGNLAALYRDANRLLDAEVFLVRQLEILLIKQESSSTIAMILWVLADIYHKVQRLEDAKLNYEKAIDVYKRIFSASGVQYEHWNRIVTNYCALLLDTGLDENKVLTILGTIAPDLLNNEK